MVTRGGISRQSLVHRVHVAETDLGLVEVGHVGVEQVFRISWQIRCKRLFRSLEKGIVEGVVVGANTVPVMLGKNVSPGQARMPRLVWQRCSGQRRRR